MVFLILDTLAHILSNPYSQRVIIELLSLSFEEFLWVPPVFFSCYLCISEQSVSFIVIQIENESFYLKQNRERFGVSDNILRTQLDIPTET